MANPSAEKKKQLGKFLGEVEDAVTGQARM